MDIEQIISFRRGANIMRFYVRLACLVLCISFLFSSASLAEFHFSDDRFQGEFTTENLERIMDEYELHDGWYWTTPAKVDQTFHGVEDAPGWTDTAEKSKHMNFLEGQYGCRWYNDSIYEPNPNGGGYGECFGFAMFIGYLLSGEKNPYKNWNRHYGFVNSNGLQVGDILRAEFEIHGKTYGHSAVVLSVTDEEILFLQVSGTAYNLINVGDGFMDEYHDNPTTLEELSKIPHTVIYRAPQNEPAAKSAQ